MKLIIATRNQSKIQEIRELMADTGIELVSAAEAGVVGEVKEDGKTFAQNALKKAQHASQQMNRAE